MAASCEGEVESSKTLLQVRETEILVEQQPPQGVLVCDHAGLVLNKFSRTQCVKMLTETWPVVYEFGEVCPLCMSLKYEPSPEPLHISVPPPPPRAWCAP